MLSGTCHCGAVRIEIPSQPEALTLCNCSVCRRYGGLWAYFDVGTVTVTGHPETLRYTSGEIRRCVTCAVSTAVASLTTNRLTPSYTRAWQ